MYTYRCNSNRYSPFSWQMQRNNFSSLRRRQSHHGSNPRYNLPSPLSEEKKDVLRLSKRKDSVQRILPKRHRCFFLTDWFPIFCKGLRGHIFVFVCILHFRLYLLTFCISYLSPKRNFRNCYLTTEKLH